MQGSAHFHARGRVPILAVLIVLVAFGAGASVAGGAQTTKITAGGRIGPLRLGHSGRAAIVAFAGEPQADETVEGSVSGGSWEGLGYDCGSSFTGGPLTAPPGNGETFCRTVYYLNPRNGRLGTFFTSLPSFVDGHGVSVGTPTAQASRREGAPAVAGCLQGIRLSTSTAYFDIAIDGGHIHRRGRNTLVRGGRVAALVLHSRSDDVGNFDCL
jgi:hypothetical protein